MVGTVEAAGVYSGARGADHARPGTQPFLDDHRIDGTAVLPGVMGIEAFAEVAAAARTRLAGRRGRGRRVPGAAEVLPRRAADADDHARRSAATARDLIAVCAARRLSGSCPASDEPQHTTHFTGHGAARRGRPVPPDDADARHGGSRTVASRGRLPAVLPRPGLPGGLVGLALRRRATPLGWPMGLPDDHAPMTGRRSSVRAWSSCASRRPGCGRAAEHGRLALPRHVDACAPAARSGTGQRPAVAVADTSVDDAASTARCLDDRRRSGPDGRGLPHRAPAGAAVGRRPAAAGRDWPRRCFRRDADPPPCDRQPGRARDAGARRGRASSTATAAPAPITTIAALHRRRCARVVRPAGRRGDLPGPRHLRRSGRRSVASRAYLDEDRWSQRCSPAESTRSGSAGASSPSAPRSRNAVRGRRHRLRRAGQRDDPAARRQGRGKRLAEKAGVPVVPWSGGPVDDRRRRQVRTPSGSAIPLMLKAAAGGGGRGIRLVREPGELADASRPRAGGGRAAPSATRPSSSSGSSPALATSRCRSSPTATAPPGPSACATAASSGATRR